MLIFSNVDYVDTWKAMEKLVESGLVKSIGVSNFNSEQITRILSVARIKPVMNQVGDHPLSPPQMNRSNMILLLQVECSPTINQKKLTKFCRDRDILITGFCPLGPLRMPSRTFSEKVKLIADKHGKTSAQIVLRYLIELGVIPIPKSVRQERIEQNVNVFDFQLTEDDHRVMDAFNTGRRMVAMHDAMDSPHWPYGIEF